jgi:ABC-2 type transport system permease protein
MKQLQNVWYMMGKDLRLFAADKLALGFAILFPFMFVILFNFLLSGVGSSDSRLQLRLATLEAPGGMSYQLISAMETRDPAALKPGEPEIVWLKDYARARQDVEDPKLSGFIGFPADFTEAVMMGYGTHLEVIYNASDTQANAALVGLARSIASEVGTRQVVSDVAIGLMVEQSLQSPSSTGGLGQAILGTLGGQAIAAPPPLVTLTVDQVGEVKPGNPSNYVIPGYLVMFTFFTAALSAGQMVRERQNRTLERMMSTSASRTAIIGGVFGGTAAKGLVQIAIFWTVGTLAFKINLGVAPAGVILISVLMVLMSAAFGTMLATLVRTEKSASAIGVLTSLILAPLGGCWWPLFVEPRWMQTIAKVTPHAWANTGFNKLMVFGADFGAAIPEMLVLAGFAVAFAVIAVMRFRTEAD